MCHCIFFGINPRVSKHHAFRLNRATWWQLGLSSKEDIYVSLCQLLVEHWQGRPLLDSQQSFNSDVVFMQEQVCSLEEVHCGSARSTAGDGGFRDTRTTHRLYHFIKEGTYRSCQWLLESFDLGSLCWLTFGGKSTELAASLKLHLDLIAPKLGPLRRRRVNIGQIPLKQPLKQVK